MRLRRTREEKGPTTEDRIIEALLAIIEANTTQADVDTNLRGNEVQKAIAMDVARSLIYMVGERQYAIPGVRQLAECLTTTRRWAIFGPAFLVGTINNLLMEDDPQKDQLIMTTSGGVHTITVHRA
jgi:hypothetical protein